LALACKDYTRIKEVAGAKRTSLLRQEENDVL
jgi:hypothetical protein